MPHAPTPRQAIIYTRVSTKEQGDSRLGTEGQEAACRAFCEREGLQVAGLHQDVASGALHPSLRPGLQAAWQAVRKAKGAVLVVAKLDRLSRVEAVIHGLVEQGRPFVTAEDGFSLDPMMLSLKAMIAQQERRMIGARTSAALQAKKARGEALGCALHRDPQATQEKRLRASSATNRATADAFALAVGPTLRAMVSQGMTCAQVAEAMNAARTPTPRGGTWHASTVSKTLARTRG